MRNKILITLFIIIGFIHSCNKFSDYNLYKALSKCEKDVFSIELLNLGSGKKTHVANALFRDLEKLKKIDGIWNFKKQFLVISYTNGLKDTIVTDGSVFLYKNKYYRREDKKNILFK